MYGLPQKVANVTANGEEIIDVEERGACDSCVYYYDNDKEVIISIEKNMIFVFSKDNGIFHSSIEDNTENNYERYITKEERKRLVEDAKERYRMSHIYCKSKK